MNAEFLGLICRDCGRKAESSYAISCQECGAPLRAMFSEESLKQVLACGLPSSEGRSYLRQWRAILPISDESLIDRVSLGEVETQLLPSHIYGKKLGVEKLYFKVEQGPTLSLKDRGTALCVLKALEAGSSTVCLSSSGNNAASVSAYGARAGLRALVFVQKHVSDAKIFKSLVYGGQMIRVDGDMAAASRICNELVARHGWFQCGGPNPYRLAGKRTFVYGLVQQLGRAPDTILMPCGGGAGMVAAWDGLRELRAAGVIDRMPRLVGVQLEACNPTAQAFHAGAEEVTPVQKGQSLSDAIMNNNPHWGKYCVQAARETGGTMISVSDQDFLRTIRELGREEGLFTEPAGAVTSAALAKLVRLPGFENPGLTVCTLTGHGLNTPQVATNSEEISPPVAAQIDKVEEFLRQRGLM